MVPKPYSPLIYLSGQQEPMDHGTQTHPPRPAPISISISGTTIIPTLCLTVTGLDNHTTVLEIETGTTLFKGREKAIAVGAGPEFNLGDRVRLVMIEEVGGKVVGERRWRQIMECAQEGRVGLGVRLVVKGWGDGGADR